jgi:DNA-binding NarL/FixJ family response regulator
MLASVDQPAHTARAFHRREMVFHAGATNKAIADKLFISDCNLRNDLTSIYNKLGLANRLELLV